MAQLWYHVMEFVHSRAIIGRELACSELRNTHSSSRFVSSRSVLRTASASVWDFKCLDLCESQTALLVLDCVRERLVPLTIRTSGLYMTYPLPLDVHDCYEDPPYECSRDCQLYSPSVSLRRATAQSQDSGAPLVYVYESGSRKRKMALPKGDCFRPRDMPESYRYTTDYTPGTREATCLELIRKFSRMLSVHPRAYDLVKVDSIPYQPTDRTTLSLRALSLARYDQERNRMERSNRNSGGLVLSSAARQHFINNIYYLTLFLSAVSGSVARLSRAR
uniref:Uncharacterized protein n=1 Tax=Timema monikensis TaxID=170555 RepID=A0A7R9HNP0_9NEOP|nr:unnamed protein product [Timema monikensis]